MPKVSIIVPVYNAENYINKCIESLLSQTLKDIEIIAVDDGSTDSGYGILLSYSKIDPRLKVIRCENGGVSRARNIGIEFATGDYIGFADADDWVESNMYEEMYGNSEKYSLDVCICDFYREYVNREPIPEKINLPEDIILPRRTVEEELIKGTLYSAYFGAVWKLLIKRKILVWENIRFSEKLDFMEDNIFDLHLYYHAKRIMYIRRYYYHYRTPNAGNLSLKYKPDLVELMHIFVKETNRFIDQHYLPFSEYRYPYELGLCFIAANCILNICKRTNSAFPRDKIRKIEDLLTDEFFFESIKQIDKNECFLKVCKSSSPPISAAYSLLVKLMQKRRVVLLYLGFSANGYLENFTYNIMKCRNLFNYSTKKDALKESIDNPNKKIRRSPAVN